MPLYVFKCSKCSTEVEKLQNHSTPPSHCPGCKETLCMEKQFSAPSFVFKGTGFYQTDYKHK